MLFGLGAGEVLLILFLALIFIGPKKLPQLAKSLGEGIREFQKAKDGMLENIENSGKQEQQNTHASTSNENSETVMPKKDHLNDTTLKTVDLGHLASDPNKYKEQNEHENSFGQG